MGCDRIAAEGVEVVVLLLLIRDADERAFRDEFSNIKRRDSAGFMFVGAVFLCFVDAKVIVF